MSITDADIAAAIAATGPLFETETTNAATGETGAEAAQAIQEAVAAVEGEQAPAEGEPAPEQSPEPEPEKPKDDPIAKRFAAVAREKARVEAERARIRAERDAIAEQRRAIEEFQQRKARAKDDPFEFLKAETGLEFEDLARSIIAKAEPPKEPDPLEEAKSVRQEVEALRKELERREMQQRYETAAREIRSQLATKLDEFPALKTAITNPEVRHVLNQMGAGDPEQSVIDTIAHAWREGLQVELDGKVYTWPRGTDLPVDVAARIVDNGVMLLARRFSALTGSTQAMPTSASKATQMAETSTPGKSATRPRTLSNTRASTPTSPLRESRSYTSEEDEIRDLARRFDVWKD